MAKLITRESLTTVWRQLINRQIVFKKLNNFKLNQNFKTQKKINFDLNLKYRHSERKTKHWKPVKEVFFETTIKVLDFGTKSYVNCVSIDQNLIGNHRI